MKSFVWGGVAGAVLAFAVIVLFGFTLFPRILLGYLGMPRRYHAYQVEGGSAAGTQTGRMPQFENASVKVWKTVVAPGSPTAMHRHDHPRIVVALTDGTMALVGSNGKREEHRWEAGKAYWLPTMPPGAMHTDENAGLKPLDVMVIELEKE